MNFDFNTELIKRLEADFYMKKSASGWLQKGLCPRCGKNELYTHMENPRVIRCGRLNNCGYIISVKELYPDLFESWSDRYPVTNDDPYAAASAYLKVSRGFDIAKIAGCYSQGSYYDGKTGQGSATVKFQIAENVWWERIVDRAQRFDRKCNFLGSYAGVWWCPPQLTSQLASSDEIWITEGIFDALALWHHGMTAVSIMSCANYPAKSLEALYDQCDKSQRRLPRLVWALDNDHAGKTSTKKFVRLARDDGWPADAAQPPDSRKKLDWNDLHIQDRLHPEHITRYRYYGKLLTADSARQKAVLIQIDTGLTKANFEYNNAWHMFETDNTEENKEESIKVRKLISCWPVPLYIEVNTNGDKLYFMRILRENGKQESTGVFNNVHLSCRAEFKKRMLNVAGGCVYSGDTQQLDQFLNHYAWDLPEVFTIDYIGYCAGFDTWIFQDYAVKQGKIYGLNKEGFFDIGKMSFKTRANSPQLTLHCDFKRINKAWIDDIWMAMGAKGLAVLAMWTGSFFASQLREKTGFFPFLELVGEPGSGKTTLLEFLWKLCGRYPYEGFDPSKSTAAGRARNFAQVSNLPVVLIEGDRIQDNTRGCGFDWDELKSLYNGRSVRARGVNNSGNDTYEPAFKGSIVITQNTTVEGSPALMERIICIHTDKSQQNDYSRQAAERLRNVAVADAGGFMLLVLERSQDIMAVIERAFPGYVQEMRKRTVTNYRIAENHALLLTLVDVLAMLFPLAEERITAVREVIYNLATERMQTCDGDLPVVQDFWDTFDYLNGIIPLNHSHDAGTITINLNHFIQAAAEYRQQVPPVSELKKHLKTGKRHKFIGIGTVRSVINESYNLTKPVKQESKPDTVKCWKFKR